jgi:hypothetical protein
MLTNFPYVVETGGSLRPSLDLVTDHYSEPNQPFPTTPLYSSKINFNIILSPNLCLPSRLFHSGFPTSILHALLSPILAISPAHLVPLDRMGLFGEEYKSLSSSLCSYLLPLYPNGKNFLYPFNRSFRGP